MNLKVTLGKTLKYTIKRMVYKGFIREEGCGEKEPEGLKISHAIVN